MRRLVERSGKSRSHAHPGEALVRVAKRTESDDIEGYSTTLTDICKRIKSRRRDGPSP